MKLKTDFDKKDLREEVKKVRDKFATMAENPYFKEAQKKQAYQASVTAAALDDILWILDSRKDDFHIGRWNRIRDDRGYPAFCCSECCHNSDYAWDFCHYCGNQKRLIIELPDVEE